MKLAITNPEVMEILENFSSGLRMILVVATGWQLL